MKTYDNFNNSTDDLKQYEMNDYKSVLAGNKFMPEMYLRQSRSTYSTCGRFA